MLSADILRRLPPHVWSREDIDRRWKAAVAAIGRIFDKVLVLDDDPTGSQTVYDLPVYTGLDDLLAARRDASKVVYVLTNSRSLHAPESEALHQRLMRNWLTADPDAGETLVISRSDSTLRGHFPLETFVIREEIAAWVSTFPTAKRNSWTPAPTPKSGVPPITERIIPPIRGEVLVPFFPEGGRFTVDDVHYVREGDALIPAGETEFARDSTFGYRSSNLREYIEEKTSGETTAAQVVSVGLDALRRADVASISAALIGLPAGGRVIVNAADYDDLKVFVVALADALEAGARFVFRSAAALVKVVAGLDDRPLLTRLELFGDALSSAGAGLLVAGSYVGKTTAQLASLVEKGLLTEVKLNIREALAADRFPAEVRRAREEAEKHLRAGRSVGLYTTNAGRREFLSADESGEGLTDLELSARISSGLVDIVANLDAEPSWVITKGGITSHDVAVHGLGICRAVVLGQVIPGVPAWRCGRESRWPGIPLVIFPGNVGDSMALARVVQVLLI